MFDAMDKVAILTAPTTEPAVSIQPRSKLLNLLRPTLKTTLRCHQLVSSAILFCFLRTYFAASLAATSGIAITRFIAVFTIATSRVALVQSGKTSYVAWNSKTMKKLRKKINYEVQNLVLGPGQALFVVIFWPGWWLLGGVCCAVWLCSG